VKKMVMTTALAAVVFALAATAAITLISAISTPAEAGACRCPLLYGPVICDNGKTYPNPCYAECRGGKNCVPTGEL
jgi:hypothetical protein